MQHRFKPGMFWIEFLKIEFEKFLQAFSSPGTLKFRSNKWVDLNRKRRKGGVDYGTQV